MRVLAVHNYYLQSGGEDVVFKAECELLRGNGHSVVEYTDSNTRIASALPVSIALQTVWSWESYAKISQLIKGENPDVVHFHNTFPLISPSAYFACERFKVPVVQTLHNYRLFCPAATLYREGGICEQCLGRHFSSPAIRYKCFHNSTVQTGVVSTSIFFHKILRTFQSKVKAYIALTSFAERKFIEAGLPAEKIFVKPNFVADTSELKDEVREDFAMFVGRFVPEKGLATLISAWNGLEIPIYIFGSGEIPVVREVKNIKLMGFANRETILSYMRRARMLIFPSEWYEGFPVTLAEAFLSSLPVVTSNIGSQAEIVKDGYSGVHFQAGDPVDLRSKVLYLLRHPDMLRQMSNNARKEYEEKYTPARNYQMLMDIYQQAIAGYKG
jgi:glycosyltransferase involved in cell wall biosynthesis